MALLIAAFSVAVMLLNFRPPIHDVVIAAGIAGTGLGIVSALIILKKDRRWLLIRRILVVAMMGLMLGL